MVTLVGVLEGHARHRKATYRCDCGKMFIATMDNIASGHTKSCGCLRSAATAERSRTHGHKTGGKPTKVYAAWVNMMGRCTNPNRPDYKNYGGRGITIDPSWQSFEQFLADMGEPSDPKLTLDRIDNMQPYSKANCRWATRAMQGQNKRNCKYYTWNGQSKTLAEWARETGIGRITLLKRIQRGVPVEVALTTKGFLKAT